MRGEGQEWVVTERRPGTFTRQLFLGDTLDYEPPAAREGDEYRQLIA